MQNIKINKKMNIYKIAGIGVFAALVFAANYIQIPIPVAIGDVTRIHLGNALCLLSGMILGPIGGGLAAGIGSSIFDLLTPAYIASAPFTFVFKFILACIPGLFVIYCKNQNKLIRILGCVIGQIAYITLYIGKTYYEGILLGAAPGAMIPTIITKTTASLTNGVIAVVCCTVLYGALYFSLKKSKLQLS